MKTILIVDDSQFMREICCAVLSKQTQYLLLEASNGADCLNITLAHQPDLVLMDIEMVGQKGLEICEILKSELSYQCPFVILMTAHKLEDIAQEAFLVGADDVLEKPLNWSQLTSVIYNLLGE